MSTTMDITDNTVPVVRGEASNVVEPLNWLSTANAPTCIGDTCATAVAGQNGAGTDTADDRE